MRSICILEGRASARPFDDFTPAWKALPRRRIGGRKPPRGSAALQAGDTV